MGFTSMTSVCVLILTSAVWQAIGSPWNEQKAPTFPTDDGLLEDGLFEGDIMLSEEDYDERATVTDNVRLWPNGIIPYVIAPRPGRDKQVIRQAMALIEARSCLRFVNRTTQADYLFIFMGDTCSSYVGRIGGQQRLSLGARCANVGTVMHELMHAAGFYHEHSRSDRDEYIDIYKENIRPEKLRQFQKMHPSENRLLTPFDVHSIMMYGSSTFARVEGLITMLTKDGGYLRAVRNKRRISSSDAIRIRKLYNC